MDPLTIGIVSGASSLLSDIFDRNDAERQRKSAIDAYKRLLIPANLTEKRADNVGDTVYTKTMNELNEGAFAYRGALNPEVLRTIAMTKMSGERASAELQVEEEDRKYNQSIMEQIAQIKASPIPSINPLKSITAGVEGYFAGKQLQMSEDLLGLQGEYINALKEDVKKRK